MKKVEDRKNPFEHMAAKEASRIVSKLRSVARLTQKELAQRLKTSISAIDRLEQARSKRGPTLATLMSIADSCGCDIRLEFKKCGVQKGKKPIIALRHKRPPKLRKPSVDL